MCIIQLRTFFFFFKDRVSLSSPGCPRACYVDQVNLELCLLRAGQKAGHHHTQQGFKKGMKAWFTCLELVPTLYTTEIPLWPGVVACAFNPSAQKAESWDFRRGHHTMPIFGMLADTSSAHDLTQSSRLEWATRDAALVTWSLAWSMILLFLKLLMPSLHSFPLL